MLSDDFIPLAPINFFQIGFELGRRLNLLPDTSALCNQQPFADVFMRWDPDGLLFNVKVDKGFDQAYYPDVQKGDSVELFIDTRDVKTSGHNTRFCHHFFFLPESVEGHLSGEITHFRTEDRHPLCSPQDLQMKTNITRSSYTMNIWIPKEVLHGYEPEQFKRLGFSYRINRPRFESQYFTAKSNEFQLEEQPSLWATLRLI